MSTPLYHFIGVGAARKTFNSDGTTTAGPTGVLSVPTGVGEVANTKSFQSVDPAQPNVLYNPSAQNPHSIWNSGPVVFGQG